MANDVVTTAISGPYLLDNTAAHSSGVVMSSSRDAVLNATNTGSILATCTGIELSDSSNASRGFLTNGGTISGNSFGLTSTVDTLTLINEAGGTITGQAGLALLPSWAAGSSSGRRPFPALAGAKCSTTP